MSETDYRKLADYWQRLHEEKVAAGGFGVSELIARDEAARKARILERLERKKH